MSPLGIVRTSWVPACLFVALAALSASTWGAEAVAPGRMARDLLRHAEASCEGVEAPVGVKVPFVRASWLCFPGSAPRLSGSLPGGGSSMFSAASLRVSDDLRSAEMEDLHWLVGPSGSLRLHVAHARVRNLPPFFRASTLRPWQRSVLLSLSGSALAFATAWVVLRTGRKSRVFAIAVGLAGPAAAIALLNLHERSSSPGVAYLTIPLGAFGALALVSVCLHGMMRPA